MEENKYITDERVGMIETELKRTSDKAKMLLLILVFYLPLTVALAFASKFFGVILRIAVCALVTAVAVWCIGDIIKAKKNTEKMIYSLLSEDGREDSYRERLIMNAFFCIGLSVLYFAAAVVGVTLTLLG